MADLLVMSPTASAEVPDSPHHPQVSARTFLANYPFISQESQGIFVSLEKIADASGFYQFVEAVFQEGYYFNGLSHKNLMALLYEQAAVKARHKRLRLAAGLALLSPDREILYQDKLTINRQEAIFDFTLRMDSRTTFATGLKPPVAEEAARTLDEFVAVMWKQGIRFGLDLEVVSQGLAIPKNKYLCQTIARDRPPRPGIDARVEAVVKLEKDLRPIESPDGTVDLRRYQCVFPQAREGQVILRKIPATPGKEGRTMAGEAIPASGGKDLDLGKLAGPGTEVAVVGKAECLRALQPGFVSRHPSSGVVSVTDEVINYTTVGIKTGSLTLEAEHCLQYGGVGLGYQLEGNNLTLKSGAVEGGVVSRRGVITVEGNVSGGQVIALEGDVVVKGRVLAGSSLEAYRGCIQADYVEKCVLIGREVEVRRAVNATIIAEQASVAECVGTAIFAFSLKVDRAKACLGQSEVGSTLVVPIFEPPRRPVTIINRSINALIQPLPEMEAKIEKVGADPHVQMYLQALTSYRHAKDEAQAEKALAVLMPLEEKVRPLVVRWRALKAQKARLLTDVARLEAEREVWQAKIRRLEDGLQDSMHFHVNAVHDNNLFLKLYKDPRLPAHFSEIAAMDPPRRKQFETLCRQMLSEITSGHTKQRIIALRRPSHATYRYLMALLEEVPDRPAESSAPPTAEQPNNRRRESRLVLLSREDLLRYLGDPGKTMPAGRYVLKAKVDELLEGYVNDLCGLGLSLFFDRQQRYAPAFERNDKIAVELAIGAVSLEAELVVTCVNQGHRLIRVGGFFVNLSPAQHALFYKVKNLLEARLHGDAGKAKVKAPQPGQDS